MAKLLKNIRQFGNSQQRIEYIENYSQIKLTSIANHSFDEKSLEGKNIENFIGAIQVPLGLAGPVKIKGIKDASFIPLATTEGALVASISRGLKAISLSGGSTVLVEKIGVTRGPVFETSGIEHSKMVEEYIHSNFLKLQKITEKSSGYLKLTTYSVASVGTNIYVRFIFDSQDAMGMNMATFATELLVKEIEKQTKAKCLSLAGNFDIDKKPAWLNFINGRGQKISAEVTLSKSIVKEVLKSTPEKIAELVYKKCHIGSELSGSLGFNAQFANVIAAIFLATGQDLGQVVEGSLGMTVAEVDKNGDLYFAIFLPSVMVGTIGGGTGLPTQIEALSIMGVSSTGDMLKYCRLLGTAVLAGEISLIASQTEGTLAKAHKKLARKKNI